MQLKDVNYTRNPNDIALDFYFESEDRHHATTINLTLAKGLDHRLLIAGLIDMITNILNEDTAMH